QVARPGFGLQVQEIPEEVAHATGGTAGLFVAAVNSGGPGDRAGLRPGDVIVEIGGEAAPDPDAPGGQTLTMSPGGDRRLAYKRRGVTHTAVLTLTAGG